ncbi:MAG TPA: sulfotransferase [Solirubrobacteraceae bacterium]|nr:sulfotransferase [Solirubrobacteraceae bacterium]
MTWKRNLNTALTRATGLEVRRAGSRAAAPQPSKPRARKRRGNDRLVARPAFVLCTLRSGSTLLRVLINSHSQLHAPHEIHLRYISASIEKKWSERSMKEMGLDETALKYLLWDRILDRELTSSGKPYLVTKTPNDVFIADQIRECWPDSRFIFLLRHPAMIARSRQKLIGAEGPDQEKNVDLIRRYCEALDKARNSFEGLTVRYEELTADPATHTRRITDFLDVPWEPGMLDYGSKDHGRFKSGLGDWADKIKTGQVQPPEALPAPEDVPEPLRDVAARWGYMAPAGTPA